MTNLINVGDKISYVASGSFSEAEGLAGKRIKGIVVEVHRSGQWFVVNPDHRAEENASRKGKVYSQVHLFDSKVKRLKHG